MEEKMKGVEILKNEPPESYFMGLLKKRAVELNCTDKEIDEILDTYHEIVKKSEK